MQSVNKEQAEMPQFQVISACICNKDNKQYVLYRIQVRHLQKREDTTNTAIIERRYTQFLNLYNGLYAEYPNLMSSITFPKKALMGNFDNKLIETRTSAFEALLKYAITTDKLHGSKALMSFLHEPEVLQAKQLMSEKNFLAALPLLENTFTLLNNIFTDRTSQVLLILCRLVSCAFINDTNQSEKWADLALHRFEGVSDSDLLILYVPLIHVCINLWDKRGRDKGPLENRLESLRRQGVNCTNTKSLLEMVEVVEEKINTH